MTAKTEAGALALEAQRGVEHRAAIWREGFAAGLEAAADIASRYVIVGPSDMDAGEVQASSRARQIYDRIRSLEIPEAPTDDR